MGTGQFCTNPGLVLLIESPETEAFVAAIVERYRQTPPGILLSAGVQQHLLESIGTLRKPEPRRWSVASRWPNEGFRCQNTLLRVSGQEFLAQPQPLQTEAFGNGTLLVVAESVTEARKVIETLEGNLTGSIYSASDGSEDADYEQLAGHLPAQWADC